MRAPILAQLSLATVINLASVLSVLSQASPSSVSPSTTLSEKPAMAETTSTNSSVVLAAPTQSTNLVSATASATPLADGMVSPFGDVLPLLQIGPYGARLESSELSHGTSTSGPSISCKFTTEINLISRLSFEQNVTLLPSHLETSALPVKFSLMQPLAALIAFFVHLTNLLFHVPTILIGITSPQSSLQAKVRGHLTDRRKVQLDRAQEWLNTLSLMSMLYLAGITFFWRSKLSTSVDVFNAANGALNLAGTRYGVRASVGATMGIWYLVCLLILVAYWVEKRRLRDTKAMEEAKRELLAIHGLKVGTDTSQVDLKKFDEPGEALLPPTPAYSPPEKLESVEETMSWRLVGDTSGRVYN